MALGLACGWAPPDLDQIDAEMARSLLVRFDVAEASCIARFQVSAPTLDAATALAWERWDLIRVELGLPHWSPSSITVTRSDRSEMAVSLRPARHRRAPVAPSLRYPYYMWRTA